MPPFAWLALLALPVAAQNRLPAFPGAEGAGAYSTGGRNGHVYVVTNVNRSGPGSLEDAVSEPNRFVVFAVSGAIDLNGRNLKISHPNITIAGQTAPGEGIALIHGALHIEAGNAIVRHLRVRRGWIAKRNRGDAITIKGRFENVIVDHVSAAWATDENLTLTNANNVTAQYAISAEALDYFNPPQTPQRHAFGSLFGSAFDDGRMTIHHTLYAHNRLRNARTTAGGRVPPVLDFRNNVIYDAKEATSHTGSERVFGNWVGNYYKDGPSTGIEGWRDEVSHVIFAFHSRHPHRLFLDGNHVDGSEESTRDNWKAVAWGRKGKQLVTMDEVRANAPLPSPPVTPQSAIEAYESVLAEAGATLPARDIADLRIVRDVRAGTGAVINKEADIPESGRWQTYHSLPAPPDTDRDGMPDFWEKQSGLDPADASDAMRDSDGDGYANIEEYANNTDPRGSTTPVIFVAASDSRGYAGDGDPAEFAFHRTGSLEKELTVSYEVAGRGVEPLPGKVTFPRGSRGAKVAVLPARGGLEGRQIVSVRLSAGGGLHLGCPSMALVAIEPGSSPAPVRLTDIDPTGGATPEDRAEAKRVNRDHEPVRKKKELDRKRKLESK